MNTSTKYMGLDIKSPIVAGYDSRYSTAEKLHQIEESGVGAVMLRPVYEEELVCNINTSSNTQSSMSAYGETYKYAVECEAGKKLESYFQNLRQIKTQLKIPVIGSINCFQFESWVGHIKKFEDNGCDALEIDVNITPSDTTISTDDIERTFNNIIFTIRKITSIPISLRISPHFTDLAKYIQQLSWNNINGITLFNQPALINIDINNKTLCAVPADQRCYNIYSTMAWLSILNKKLHCSLTASAEIKSYTDVVKMLLAGASSIQTTNTTSLDTITFYKELHEGLCQWMQQQGYENISDFAGLLSIPSAKFAADLIRTQEMRTSELLQ